MAAAPSAREMLGSNTAEYGGEMLYINKSATKPLWAMEYSRDEAARANQDEDTPPFHKDAPDYNRNAETMAVEDAPLVGLLPTTPRRRGPRQRGRGKNRLYRQQFAFPG
jgi:hypothetical protein